MTVEHNFFCQRGRENAGPSQSHESFALAELFPPDTSFEIELRHCIGCQRALPVKRFYFNRVAGRYFSRCKACSVKQSKAWATDHPAYFEQWYKQHASRRNLYSKRHYYKLKAAGIKKKHKPATPAQRQRERLRRRAGKVAQRAEKYKSLYGDTFANTYVEMMERKVVQSGKNIIKHVKLISLPSELSGASWAACHRIEQLNILSRKPYGYLGPWLCSCGEWSGVARFFDIDHVIPRHKGGSSGYNNLQILCPNCHRRKTINDLSNQSLTQDQTACTNDCVPKPVHTKPSAAGGQGPTLSRPVSGETTQCTAAASKEPSNSCQTGSTRHTPSTFAAPTQSWETADAPRSGANA